MLRIRRLTFAPIIVLSILVGVLFTAAPAFAAKGHPYLPGLSELGGFEYASGTAVDSHGDVYVANEEFDSTISVFGTGGEFLTEFATELPVDIAVNAGGDVYSVGAQVGAVEYVPSEFPPTPSTTYKTDESLVKRHGVISKSGNAVAVDPATQDVYLGEGENISEYAPNGALLNGEIGFEVEGKKHFYSAGLAVYGANGNIYTADSKSGEVYVLNPTGTAVLAKINGTANPNFPTGFGGLDFRENGYPAIDQSNGDVYVSDIQGHGVVSEFTSSGAFVSQIGPKFGGVEELAFEYDFPSTVAVDNGASSPNEGDVYVTSGPGDVSPGSASLYAFGPVSSAAPEFKLNLSTAGAGSGSFECKVNGGPEEACAAEYEEGEAVEVIPHEAGGSEFVDWTGDCSGTGSCSVTMNTEHSVGAVFNLETVTTKFKLNLSTSGTGSGSFECDTGSGEEACAAEYPEGTSVTVIPHEAGGSEFVNWTGDCSGTGSCSVTMSAEHSVGAVFDLEPVTGAPLTVFVTGEGTVKSSPAGITNCGPLGGVACTNQFEGAVTLTATPKPSSGYVLAGWIGCKKTTATECTVDVTAASEVTAVFLLEGTNGTNGTNGTDGEGLSAKVFSGNENGCAEGGIEIEQTTSHAKTYVCNGVKGSAGPAGGEGKQGLQGFPGEQGISGAAGEKGANGANGAAGAQGPAGPAGLAGPAGKEGPAGKVQVVTCTKSGKKKKCTTKTVSGTVKFTTSSARATLSRYGIVYAAGAARATKRGISLRLLSVRKLKPGRYTLTLTSGSARNETIHSETFTLG